MALSSEIANEFLKKPSAMGRLTQMHLQKLVYIAHGWKLALTGEALADDVLEAWDYGPVFPDLYDHTKFNGRKPLSRLIRPSDGNPFIFFGDDGSDESYKVDLSDTDREIIDRVWKKYGRLSAFKLSDLTHKVDTPWHKSFYTKGKGSEIDRHDIEQHYKRLAAAA
jgi:uncharacterized phage-associated protein